MITSPVFTSCNVSDGNYEDGIERSTFEKAVRYVVTNRFNWPPAIADVIINEYTDWERVDDPLQNRKQYVHVRICD